MKPLPPILPITPFTQPVRGEVTLPGSKSITNRALLLAALCDGPVTLTGALFSEDTEIMAEALNRLGIGVKPDPLANSFQVAGQGGKIPAQTADIFVGNAGTAARFLTALCASAKTGVYKLRGVEQMHKRPMKGLIDALRSLGADVRCTGEEGFFPLEIHARGLRGGSVEIDASESSQMLSALLMVAPLAEKPLSIRSVESVREPFVQMTMTMLGRFGVTIDGNATLRANTVPLGAYHLAGSWHIGADATAASYFIALPFVVDGSVFLPGLQQPPTSLQGDIQFLDFVKKLGVSNRPRVAIHQDRISTNEGVDVWYAKAPGLTAVVQDFSQFSDTFLTLAAIAPLLEGPTTITGIAHTRKQETDRVGNMAIELRKLGQGAVMDETGDSLTITPNLAEMKKRAEAGMIEIDTYGDHRFAMSFAILGCHNLLGDGRPWLAIRNPACCAKTFPNFFDVLAKLWDDSHSRRPSPSLPPA